MSVRLQTVVARLASEQLLATPISADVDVRAITDDSRTVVAGSLFCAWAGSTTDAHEHVPAAAAQGAAAALVERTVADVNLPQVVVNDGRRAAAVAATVFYGDPQDQLTLTGVTGTNGKTTTVWILRHLLSATGAAASLGTLGVILENGEPLDGSESLTTPGPVQLARTLRQLVDRGVGVVAMEVSSHALDQGRVSTLRFDAAVFTNLTRDHLDYHGTLDSYLSAKRMLVTLLREDGCAVVNADDSAWTGLAAEAPRALTFGVAAAADVRCEGLSLGSFGARFTLRTGDTAVAVELPLLGDFNVHNALGAASACIAIGHAPAAVAQALATVPQVPGRLERIATMPCPVLRDYAHTPDALARTLETLRPLTAGRLIVVFGAGGDRDRGKRPLMGSVAEQNADLAIVTSDNPRTEDPELIIDEIAAGMVGSYERVTDRRAAIAHALAIAQSEDVILLAGKGHETYQIIGTDRRSFDERAIVAGLTAGGEVDA